MLLLLLCAACALLPRAARVQAVRLERGACPEGWLMCPGDQRCLGREYLCDGNADCLNALDESPPQCNGTCRPGAFFCGTATSVGPVRAAAAAGRPGAGATIGRCHKNWRRCDTKRDCADGSDERGCLPPDRRLLLTCDGGRVVQSRHVRCDGYLTDCRDGSDERQCGSGSACPPNTTFSCDGFCRPMARWCDRRKDCSDGSDEASCDFTLTTTTTTATTSRITATLPPPTSTSTSTTSSMNASSSPPSLTTPEATFSSKAEGGLVAAGSRPPEQQETPRVGANDTRAASAAGETSRGGGALAVVLSVIGALIFVHVAISLAAGVFIWRTRQYRPAREEAMLVTNNALYFDDLSESSFHSSGPLIVN